MKRVYGILILLILLINASGFYVYYAIQLQQIRAEMREKLKLLPDDALDILTLTQAEFKAALVDDHEVKVDGKMYDIARIKTSGDLVKVFCLHDEKEDNLVMFLEEIVCKPLKDPDEMPGSILQFLTLIFLAPSTEFCFNVMATEETNSSYSFSTQAAPLFLDTPPPWI